MQWQGIEFQMIGFDARKWNLDWQSEWGNCSRDNFLLRTDIVRPLSSDTSAWFPAVEWSDPEIQRLAGHRGFQDCSDNLQDFERLLLKLDRFASRPYWVIAIARSRDIEADEEWGGTYPFDEMVSPDAPTEEWQFLGYDVSDYFLLSGLMNCGYSEEDREGRAYFAPKLNGYHLFDSFDDADRCRLWMDDRVDSHAPFFVFALFKIREEA